MLSCKIEFLSALEISITTLSPVTSDLSKIWYFAVSLFLLRGNAKSEYVLPSSVIYRLRLPVKRNITVPEFTCVLSVSEFSFLNRSAVFRPSRNRWPCIYDIFVSRCLKVGKRKAKQEREMPPFCLFSYCVKWGVGTAESSPRTQSDEQLAG